MLEQVEVVVIGGGAMGSAAARALALRGREVLLLERFGPGHKNGASHGASRNFNTAYADPDYVDLLVEALPAWRELERETRTPLLDLVGLVNHGANPDFDDTFAAMDHAGFEPEFLDPAEASRRWPGIRFDGRVLFTPQGGRVNADAAVTALQRSAATHGATVLHNARVLELTVRGVDDVLLRYETPQGVHEITARTAVVTVGAWTDKLLGTVAHPRLVVTQEQPAHFAVRDASIAWPSFNHTPTAGDADYDYWRSPIYGMLTPGEGVKAGWHGVGPVVDPDARDFLPEPQQLAALQRYARDWLPGVDPDEFAAISCTYTTTPDSNFVLDRIGPLVIGAGFSGHGFKFTPAVGRVLADLVERRAAPALFSLGR
ncbi:FAD-dependent oxidoreductase [Glaciihabitans arcticus]|uniref:FAD-dependent oxidoreductase n=1 Tax=Glaciihabitans arcticus TaxID=2668039 RepID=A0A4Q9GMU2_9MICO|nr:FAD-dependent oxidoreductase [Glaciihabitans arcticus]TBN56016.1 FAD-dependent oxidoreductase [Glaciihabitans arcticus]